MGETSIADKPLIDKEDQEAEGGKSIADIPLSELPARQEKKKETLAEFEARTSRVGRLRAAGAPAPLSMRVSERIEAVKGRGRAGAKAVGAAALTGVGAVGTALDVVQTRPVKTIGYMVGGQGVAGSGPRLGVPLQEPPPDVSAISPSRRAEALQIAERSVQSKPAPSITLSEAWQQSVKPQWQIMSEARRGFNQDPTTGDYIIGIPAEFATDWTMLLGLGAATLPQKGGKFGLRMKPALLQQIAGMIRRRAALEPLKKGGKLGRLKRSAKWIGQALEKAGVPKALEVVGKERKLAIPGKVSEKIGRGATALRALTKAEPAVKPKTGLARLAYEAGAEPTGARVAEEAFRGTEKAVAQLDPSFWKRAGLDLTDIEKAKSAQVAELMPRIMAGDLVASEQASKIVGGDKKVWRGAAALYKGETGVTAARVAGEVPIGDIAAKPKTKLAKTQELQVAAIGRVGERAKRRLGKGQAKLMAAEAAAKEGIEEGQRVGRKKLAKLEAEEARATARLTARTAKRKGKIWSKEAGKYVEAVGPFPPKPGVAAEPLRAFEEAVDPALAAERATKAIERGESLQSIKADLFRAFGKEEYAQALHEAKTVGELRRQIIKLKKKAAPRLVKKRVAAIPGKFDPKHARLKARVAAQEAADVARTIEGKGFQRRQALISKLKEAIRTSPAHITRDMTDEGVTWLAEASLRTKPEAITRPIHAMSPSTIERTLVDPKTGRSLYLYEVDEMLERTLIDSKFAEQHADWAQVAKKADAKRGSLAVATVRGKQRMPLVSYVFETDPHKILETSIHRAIIDAEQTGFIREVAAMGSKEKRKGWTHVKKLVSKERPNPAMEELVKQFGDVYFPPDIMGELKRTVTNLTSASNLKKAVKIYDNVLGKWKWTVTAPWLSKHFRDVTSNIGMIIGNGVRAESSILADSWNYVRKTGRIDLGAASMSGKVFERKMRAWKISGSLGQEIAGRGLGAADEMFRGGYAADRLREAQSLWGDALTPKHWQFARDEVNKTLGNYRDIGKTGKFMQRTFLPFWKWTRHSVPQHVEWLFTKPYVLNAEAKAMRATGQWTESRRGVVLGAGNPLEETTDFINMAKDIVSGKKADAWRAGRWKLTPPVAELANAARLWATGGKPVRAPHGAQYMPETWQKIFGIRKVDDQWVMPSHSRSLAKLIRVFNEVKKHYKADNWKEAWLRSITGIAKSDVTRAEADLDALYDRLDEIMESFREKKLTLPSIGERDRPSRGARREPEYRDYKKIQHDIRRMRAIIKRERAQTERARGLRPDDIKR